MLPNKFIISLQKTIIVKMSFLALVMCLVFIGTSQTIEQNDQVCSCINNGVCSSFKQYPSCECPEGFIGDKCQINALKLNQKTLNLQLTENYTYFYFEPTQTNYYQLNIKLCIPQQSQQVTSLIFLQVERSTGKIKEQPSIYQTSPLHFYGRQKLCRYFSTHFIPIRKKLNQKFQKIIFGISLKGQNAIANHWLSFLQKEAGVNSQDKSNKQQVKKQYPKTQKISISCQTNLYLTQNHWGTIVIIISSITLIIASVIFVYTIKNRYNYTFTSQAILRAYNLNPEEFVYRMEHSVQKNDLSHFQTIMPVQKYKQLQKKQKKAIKKYPKNHLKRRIQMYLEEQQEQKKSEQNFNQKKQNTNPTQQESQNIETVCTICLINFQAEDKVRRTPCEHIYHSQCIDNWCETTLNCPMCRHDFQFPHYKRRLYMQYLRAQLHNDAA